MSDNTISVSDILQIGKLAEEALEGKEYFIGTVAERLNKAATRHPHDQAIRSMQAIMNNRFDKEGSLSIISQSEFQKIYQELSSLGKSEVFKTELGDFLYDNSPTPIVANYDENYVSGLRGSGTEFDMIAPEKVAELSGLFGNPEDGLHTELYVENGLKGVKLELLSMGFSNPSVEVATQDSNFVIFSAEVDTRFGRTPLLVPAEIKLGSVLLPSVFVSGNEFLDFTGPNVLKHSELLKDNGKVSTPTAVLHTLNKLSGKVSHVKTAASELDDVVSATALQGPGLYSELVEEQPMAEFAFAQVDMPKPLQGLTDDFVRETLLEAGLSYGRDIVVKAKAMLSNELNGMGLVHGKINIASEWQQGIIFATAITGRAGKKTIEVPVEIVNNKTVLMPHAFTSGTVVKSFTEHDLLSFAHEEKAGQFDAFFSDKRDMSYKELYSDALKNAAFGNFVEVEESLAVIGERFGPQLHKVAFQDLMDLVKIGFNSNEAKPLDAIDAYIKEAAAKIKDKEQAVKISNSLLYIYPEDDR